MNSGQTFCDVGHTACVNVYAAAHPNIATLWWSCSASESCSLGNHCQGFGGEWGVMGSEGRNNVLHAVATEAGINVLKMIRQTALWLLMSNSSRSQAEYSTLGRQHQNLTRMLLSAGYIAGKLPTHLTKKL